MLPDYQSGLLYIDGFRALSEGTMPKSPLKRILRDSNSPDLAAQLVGLAPTDLQSLLLAVYKDRAAEMTPARILENYQSNRFVRPSGVDPRTKLEFDRLAYSLAAPHFEPIELSPVCPLGTTSALSKVSQNNVVATSRNTEVVSDSTNCMGLECAVRRRKLIRGGSTRECVRLCTSHRLVRAQTFSGPASFAHFQVFSLCSAGRDEGNHGFECAALIEHISIYVRLLDALGIAPLRVGLTDFEGGLASVLEERVLAPLVLRFPALAVGLDPQREAGRGYYSPFCFQLFAGEDGTFLADGGLTSWTRQLLSNEKERLMISGIGSERICSLYPERARTLGM
jgi:hypothetical protein